MVRILGLDPSLASTGWGIIEVENNRLRYVADGFIARKFNMVTQLGKILDPLADKLTLFTVALTLACSGYKYLFLLAAVLFVKEILMLCGGVILARHYNDNKMESSKWFGKFATALLYIVMFGILLNLRQTTVHSQPNLLFGILNVPNHSPKSILQTD